MHGNLLKSKDSQMDIHKSMDNWRRISIKHGYPFMDIYCFRISIAECPCKDIRAWISMWISTLVWITEDWHPKIMDIHVDIRRFLEIHAWICYVFSDQGNWAQPVRLHVLYTMNDLTRLEHMMFNFFLQNLQCTGNKKSIEPSLLHESIPHLPQQ